MYFKGFPRKSDYPEKDGWRDEEEYYRQLQSWHNVWGEERRLLQYSSISRRRKKGVMRRREEFFSEMTKEHLQGRYKSNLYTYGLQPGVIRENNRAEKKLDEEPQEDDSCSQATTARGSTRAVAFSMQYKLWGKNKIKKDKQRHCMCESGDPWRQVIRKILDKDKGERYRAVWDTDSEDMLGH